MEIALTLFILVFLVVEAWYIVWTLGKHKEEQNLHWHQVLTEVEILRKSCQELTNLLDNAKVVMHNVAEMEKRLAKREDARETQRILREQGGDWRAG